MTRKTEPPIYFEDVDVQHETPKALLIDFGDGEGIWIPRSQVKESFVIEGVERFTDLKNGQILLTKWIAEQKELI